MADLTNTKTLKELINDIATAIKDKLNTEAPDKMTIDEMPEYIYSIVGENSNYNYYDFLNPLMNEDGTYTLTLVNEEDPHTDGSLSSGSIIRIIVDGEYKQITKIDGKIWNGSSYDEEEVFYQYNSSEGDKLDIEYMTLDEIKNAKWDALEVGSSKKIGDYYMTLIGTERKNLNDTNDVGVKTFQIQYGSPLCIKNQDSTYNVEFKDTYPGMFMYKDIGDIELKETDYYATSLVEVNNPMYYYEFGFPIKDGGNRDLDKDLGGHGGLTVDTEFGFKQDKNGSISTSIHYKDNEDVNAYVYGCLSNSYVERFYNDLIIGLGLEDYCIKHNYINNYGLSVVAEWDETHNFAYQGQDGTPAEWEYYKKYSNIYNYNSGPSKEIWIGKPDTIYSTELENYYKDSDGDIYSSYFSVDTTKAILRGEQYYTTSFYYPDDSILNEKYKIFNDEKFIFTNDIPYRILLDDIEVTNLHNDDGELVGQNGPYRKYLNINNGEAEIKYIDWSLGNSFTDLKPICLFQF